MKERLKKKRRKMKARDITLAMIKQENEIKNTEEGCASDTGDDITS